MAYSHAALGTEKAWLAVLADWIGANRDDRKDSASHTAAVLFPCRRGDRFRCAAVRSRIASVSLAHRKTLGWWMQALSGAKSYPDAWMPSHKSCNAAKEGTIVFGERRLLRLLYASCAYLQDVDTYPPTHRVIPPTFSSEKH